MKKIIFSAAALLAMGFAAQSQEVKYGVKAGLNVADFGGDAKDTKVKTGFTAGVLAEFKFGNIAIQPEILYSQQGAKSEIIYYNGDPDSSDGIIEYTAKLGYINVPVALKYYIIEGLSLQAGPQIGFLISAKEKGDATANGESLSVEVDAKDIYEKIDFSIFGGIGYDLPIGVFFQARYNAGLANINKDPKAPDAKLTNNVFSFSVGYKF
jgi:hypothetical protein